MLNLSRFLLRMKIGTHSGHFHADEALACFFLKSLPEYAEASIVRSRDLKVLDQCDIVVDVGARFEVTASDDSSLLMTHPDDVIVSDNCNNLARKQKIRSSSKRI